MTEENLNHEAPTEGNSKVRPGRPFVVTMEVPLCLVMLGLSLSITTMTNIVLYRTCVHSLHYPVEECRLFLTPERSNETNELEVEVQKYATAVTTVKMVLESIVPAILSMFLTVWSDAHGRKPLVAWPLLGITLTAILNVAFSIFEGLGPWWYLLPVVPFSLTGGYIAIYTGAFCYLSDITTTQNRSLRMTVLEASVTVGNVIGSLASSHLLKAIGSVYLLVIVTVLCVVAYLFTKFLIKESLEDVVKGDLRTILDPSLVKEMFRGCFKRRPNYLRAQLLLVTVAMSVNAFILYGSMGVSYLYTRQKLQWALKDFTQYSAVSTTISFVGSFFGVAVMQKYLRISDLTFSIIAFASATADHLIKGFAFTTWHMYLGSALALFAGLSAPLLRSFLTKILPVQDIAKFFALLSAIQGLCPVVAPVLYNTLYTASISSFPGAFWVMSGGITFISILMMGLVAFLRVKAAQRHQLDQAYVLARYNDLPAGRP